MTGDELLAFINNEETTRPDGKRGAGLFRYLRTLTSSNGDDRREVIATVFRGVQNRMVSGYLLRDVINKLNGIQGNFPEDKQTAETALLFLQLIMRKLRRSASSSLVTRHSSPRCARAAVVVPNGTLFGDGVCARIKSELLQEFNLHTIVRLPNGVFAPYTSIPTNILFFDRSGPTREVWYYEQPLPIGRKNYTKTAPIQFEEFADCIQWWTKREENERAWRVPVTELLEYNPDGSLRAVNLDRKNPRGKEDITHLPPEQLAADILKKVQRIAEIMGNIQKLLAGSVKPRDSRP
ncbi:MAG: N-6 DNA methylase [Verrucomicrobia bacterium]|nr:N-6 DNA methylase [Verrucomicrobiota bacterium]